jgi:hypothetical protein
MVTVRSPTSWMSVAGMRRRSPQGRSVSYVTAIHRRKVLAPGGAYIWLARRGAEPFGMALRGLMSFAIWVRIRAGWMTVVSQHRGLRPRRWRSALRPLTTEKADMPMR